MIYQLVFGVTLFFRINDKKDTLVEMTLPENNEQIFASRYLTVLPTKEELKLIVEEETRNIERIKDDRE